MDPTQSDNPTPPAPQGTPGQAGTPPEPSSTPPSAAPPEGTTKPEKVYAGKFKTAEDLETAYKSLETKLGQKAFSENLGQKVVDATGYSVDDLQKAGYTPDQIVDAVINWQAEKDNSNSGKEEISRKVEDTRYNSLEWRVDLQDYFTENPEAKQFADELNDFHSMPQYKELKPKQLFEQKVSKFLSKSEENLQAQYSDKEKANLSISNSAPPPPDEGLQHAQNFKKSGRLDDAAKFLRGRLFPKN